MSKARLEAFSDGVFAIVITLLVLDIRIPDVDYSQLSLALRGILPSILSYVLSFALIGVYWVGHQYYMKMVHKTNGIFTWLNILLLLSVSVLPVPTSLLGKYPYESIPVFIYGLNLLLVNTISLFMLLYVYHRKDLASEHFTHAILKNFIRLYALVNFVYLAGAVAAFWYPRASWIAYVITLAFVIKVYAKRED